MTQQVSFELPFPPRGLSPNSRQHWRVKASLAAQYRETCGWVGKETMQRYGLTSPLEPPVRAEVTFVLPNRRRRDPDNLMASLKAAWDGLVDAGLLVDDRVGMFTPAYTGEVEYGRTGAVKVVLKR